MHSVYLIFDALHLFGLALVFFVLNPTQSKNMPRFPLSPDKIRSTHMELSSPD